MPSAMCCTMPFACSTPSGIKAVLTGPTRSLPTGDHTRAQRLPASRRFSRLQPPVFLLRHQRVLNAFRHQGGSHAARQRRERDNSRSAQRLPASRRFSRRDRPRHTHHYTRAQRLPASRRFSPLEALREFRENPLCSTPSGIKAVLTSSSAKVISRPHSCSTPSGIKAVLTRDRERAAPTQAGAQRLPASRRFSPRAPAPVASCGRGAQRLPASRRFSRRRDEEQCVGKLLVLNAFRHQGGSHRSSIRVSGKPPCREFFMDPISPSDRPSILAPRI